MPDGKVLTKHSLVMTDANILHNEWGMSKSEALKRAWAIVNKKWRARRARRINKAVRGLSLKSTGYAFTKQAK
jgi:hypothetical protein